MLRKSLSSIYNINNIGFSDLNKFNQSNSLYYTNLRKAINIPSQNKNNNFKANVLNYNYGNSIHKVHLDNMLNQLKDKINEMNNNNYNIPYKNYNYGNNAQIKKITPIHNYHNSKNYNIINRTYHDLYQNSNNSFVEPVNKHPFEERNEIEYFKLKKRYSATPKRFIYQVKNNLDDNPFSYRNLKKKMKMIKKMKVVLMNLNHL